MPRRQKYWPLSHGLWARDITKRIPRSTKQHFYRFINALIEDLPDLSNREKTLIVLTIPLIISCNRYGLQLLAGEDLGSRDFYLAELATIRRNLAAIGLKKGTLKKILNLEDYLGQKPKLGN